MSLGKKILIGVGAFVGVLVVAGVVLFNFGGMVAPTDAVKTAYAAEVTAGRQPAIQSRFVIGIPGCVCHSTDPALQMQHSVRRMSECQSCHKRG